METNEIPIQERRTTKGKLSLPAQVVPVPLYPELQAQLKVPGPVEEHVALDEQLLVPKVQLLMAGGSKKRGRMALKESKE